MIRKVFITRSGSASFACPECGKIRRLDVSRYNAEEKEVKLKYTCTCGHIFSVILERRKHVRRKVDLPGVLIMGEKKYPVNVIDISRMGLKIKTRRILDLHPEDKAVVAFTLDDVGESRVSKDVVIRKINQAAVSVEFLSHEHYDKFGPYLLFHFG